MKQALAADHPFVAGRVFVMGSIRIGAALGVSRLVLPTVPGVGSSGRRPS